MVLRYDHVVIIGALFGIGVWLLCVGQVDVLHETARAPAGAPSSWRRPILGALALHVLAALALPLVSNDVFSNIHYGHLEVYQGIDAYTATPEELLAGAYQPWVGDRWRTAVCVYGPPLLWISDLAAWIAGPQNLYGAMFAFKALMLIVGASMVWLAWLYARELPNGGERLFVFWFLAANPVWLIEISGQAHNDGVMVVLMVGAVIAHKRGRWLACAALLGLGICTKYIAAVPFAFLLLWELWLGERPLAGRLGRVGAQLLVATTALVAPYLISWRGWAMIVRPLADLTGLRIAYSFLRLLYYSFYLSGQRAMRTAFTWGSRVLWVALGSLTFVWLRRWPQRRGDSDVPIATALRFLLLHTLLLNSHFLPWYLTWLLPLLLCEPDRQWWIVVLIYGFFSLFHYALDIIVYNDIAEEIINTLWMHLPPLIMLVRLARGLPVLFGEKWVPLLRRLGNLSRRKEDDPEEALAALRES
jgi:hypothetical protein